MFKEEKEKEDEDEEDEDEEEEEEDDDEDEEDDDDDEDEDEDEEAIAEQAATVAELETYLQQLLQTKEELLAEVSSLIWCGSFFEFLVHFFCSRNQKVNQD